MSHLENTRKITVRDVAQLAGVSDATVSRVFNNYNGISRKHRQAVMDAAEQLGYTPKKPANRRVINHIAFCLRQLDQGSSQASNHYFSQILRGVQDECARRDIRVQLLTVTAGSALITDIQRAVRQGTIDALLLVNLLSPVLIEPFLSLELPTVLIEDYFNWLPVDAVISDGFNGVSAAMRYLLGNGHQQIAFIDGPHEHYQARMRYLAYRQTLEAAHIPYDSDLVAQGGLIIEGGRDAMRHILATGKPFTAVMCSNDSSAFGAIQVLRERGYAIPDDVSVIGHDDVEAAPLVTPPLTTLHAQRTAIGRLAVSRLIERATSPDSIASLFLTQETLVERMSVRSIRNKP
jgi:DNA-binding LacI/PurR family transcriptional regulator